MKLKWYAQQGYVGTEIVASIEIGNAKLVAHSHVHDIDLYGSMGFNTCVAIRAVKEIYQVLEELKNA